MNRKTSTRQMGLTKHKISQVQQARDFHDIGNPCTQGDVSLREKGEVASVRPVRPSCSPEADRQPPRDSATTNITTSVILPLSLICQRADVALCI